MLCAVSVLCGESSIRITVLTSDILEMLTKRIILCVSRRQMGTSAKEAQEAISESMKKERLFR